MDFESTLRDLESAASPGFANQDLAKLFSGGTTAGSFGLISLFLFLAGTALLLYLLWGGIDIMLGRGDPKKAASAKGKITNAIIGFIIVFAAYWLVQILSRFLGLDKVTNTFGN